MDAVPQKRAAEAFLTVLCPTGFCIGVGLITCGTGVFAPRSALFQLGVNAVVVGVLVLVARRWSTGRFLAAAVLVTLGMTILTVRSGPRITLHTVLLMAMWVGAVLLNVKILGRCRWVQATGQYAVWSLVFAAGLFGVGAVLVILFGASEEMTHLVFYARLSVVTGLGLGTGFKVQEWLCVRLRGGSI